MDTGFIIKTCQSERKHKQLVIYKGVSTTFLHGIFEEFQRHIFIGFHGNNWSKVFSCQGSKMELFAKIVDRLHKPFLMSYGWF